MAVAEAMGRKEWMEMRATMRSDLQQLVTKFRRQGGDELGSEDSSSVNLLN